MPEKFQIVQICPDNYLHCRAFDEIVLLLKYSFDSLGYDCLVSKNIFSKDRINIILGSNLLKYDDSLRQCKYIPYQLEQLYDNSFWLNENLKSILKNAFQVWDYSQENINFLKRQNIIAKCLPIGYHEKLETINHSQNKDIDVLFFGSINERRKQLLDKLNFCKLKVLFGVYGKERDDYIARSKIILNIHFYPTKILETIRISYLLNNKCFILSEESLINPYEKVSLTMCDYNKIPAYIKELLKNTELIDKIAIQNYLQFKENYSMIENLKKVLSSI